MYTTDMTASRHAWNPTIGSDCSGLYLYHYVCVGIQPQTSMSIPWNTAGTTATLPDYVSVTPTPLPTYDYQEPFVPTPTHGPLPTNCMDWYQAQPVRFIQSCSSREKEASPLITATPGRHVSDGPETRHRAAVHGVAPFPQR